jgi:hypothetical protein
MSLEDVKKTTPITKSSLFDWNAMPFGMKNATNTFSRTMTEVFKEYMDKFLKKGGRFEWVVAYANKVLSLVEEVPPHGG